MSANKVLLEIKPYSNLSGSHRAKKFTDNRLILNIKVDDIRFLFELYNILIFFHSFKYPLFLPSSSTAAAVVVLPTFETV